MLVKKNKTKTRIKKNKSKMRVKKNNKTLKKMKENFHILHKESEQKNKQLHIKKDVKENELQNTLQELDDNDNKIFELKTLKKSETHQLKIYKDRQSSLVKKIDTFIMKLINLILLIPFVQNISISLLD